MPIATKAFWGRLTISILFFIGFMVPWHFVFVFTILELFGPGNFPENVIRIIFYIVLACPFILTSVIAYIFFKPYFEQKKVVLFSLASPFVIVAVFFGTQALMGLILSGADTLRRNAFLKNPPPSIATVETSGYSEIEADPLYEDLYIFPEDEVEIIFWDGTKLTYKTNLPPEKVNEFYSESFDIMGFDISGTYSGAKGHLNMSSDTTVRRKNQKNIFQIFTVEISNSETLPTLVRLEPCKVDVMKCLSTR